MLTCDFQFQRMPASPDYKHLGQHFKLHVQLHTQASVTGILGASGAGKSTILKILVGLIAPQQGSITFKQQRFFDSHTQTNIASYRRHVGLMFQDAQLFPHLNVKQNLLYGYKHIAADKRRFELAQVVELLEIGHLITRKTSQLSGGEAQRVALGRALLYSPQLLLLDEPLSALDQRLKQQILPFFARVRDETQIPMIYVTHQPQELEYLQADIIQMTQGKLIHLP